MKQQRLQINRKSKKTKKDIVHIELDTKCSCPQSTSNDNALIQFTRRYLKCQSSMPIRIIRLFIEASLFHSPMTKVSIFDSNNCLLKDSDRLSSLKHKCSSSPYYISLRFQLINNVTSLANCSCLSAPIEHNSSSSYLPSIIQQENMEQILSTCSIISQPSPFSSCLLPSSSSSSSSFPNLFDNPIAIADLRHSTSFFVDSILNISMINQITSELSEKCLPLIKRKRYRVPKKVIPELPFDIPLDLRIKNIH
ncbi:unnamed protein product [Rotaria sp. Silwood1]|nr:unnamed protein product [Rotaria sp. Silwood1]CAF1184480.1 unnamed protein product [Rotaria sp. Silwood1]CAF3453103.1 unnamed protein product [Rotaria sp. Silwood1]CAF3478481.1 unnamed protein product [Rotaria sp. Silwood1]CAF4602576.1 unnamed protein product [Rotaria sp. Silwood1]